MRVLSRTFTIMHTNSARIAKIKECYVPIHVIVHPIRNEHAVDSAVVFRGSRLVVPGLLRESIVRLAHDTHPRLVQTKQRLRELYWWPCMDALVHPIIASCTTCQSSDKTASMHPAPMKLVELPNGPFQKVIMGPFEKGRQDCSFAICLVDYFSRWPEVVFAGSVTTTSVATFLASVFSHEGNPCTIVTDNSLQFFSSVFTDFLKEHGIKHIRFSVYHPQANDCSEHFNSVLKNSIQLAELHEKPWKSEVTRMLHTYRVTPHVTINVTPFQLMRGQSMPTKLNILLVHNKDDNSKHQRKSCIDAKEEQGTY